MLRSLGLALALSLSSVGAVAEAKGGVFMPKNDLDLQDSLEAKSGITQAQFNAVIDRAEKIFKPIVAKQGGTLAVQRLWSDSTVNADAEQYGSTWNVNMYGGLARRKEITEDGFAMVLCHEIGHHLGGYPYVEDWAADEGQADTFATGPCAKLIYNGDKANASARSQIPAVAKAKCDAVYSDQEAQDLCYRVLLGGKSTADLLAALGNEKVDFAAKDPGQVTTTDHTHPAAQCRLDTYVASAICTGVWDSSVIPGKVNGTGVNSVATQTQSGLYYCQDAVATPNALRPRCWYKPL